MSQALKVASQPGHAPRGSTSSRWPNSQAGGPSPPNLPQEKDRHLESRDGHLCLAAGGWENDLNSSSTSEDSPYSLCEVDAGYACSHRMRNWRNAGMDRPRFAASREAAASGAYATLFWESPGCGMCFRARRRLSRRERMAGECAKVLSRPLIPSMIGSLPADTKITATVAENACDPQRTAEATGRPMDGSDKLVVDDWCSAPMPASGRLRRRRALQEPPGLTVDDEPLNHPVVD